MKKNYTTIDEYIADFPENIREFLEQIRQTIQQIEPEAEESISYSLPTFKLNKKPLVYFGGYKNHIGFYATPNGHQEFSKELSRYKHGKGSVQFPITEPMPLQLIAQIVKFRIKQNKEKLKNN